MKNNLLILCLSLTIVLSSFISAFAQTVPAVTYTAANGYLTNGTYNFVIPGGYYNIFDGNGVLINGSGSGYVRKIELSQNHLTVTIYNPAENTPFITADIDLTNKVYPFNIQQNSDYSALTYKPFGTYANDSTPIITDGIDVNGPDIRTVTINPTQMIVFNYTDTNKSLFLKSLRVTPNKGIILQQGYYLDGDLSSLAIRKDTSGFTAGGLFNQNSLSLTDFPVPRTLNTNEYLAFFQSNDNLGLSPISSSNKLAYFEFDSKKCSYKIIDRFSGTVIDGVTSPGTTTPGDITVSSDGNSGITPDYELDRGEFADGIIGTIQFMIADFVNMISSLFTLGLSAISTLVSNGAAFMGSIVSMFSWLPGPVSAVIQSGLILLVIIGVFKMFL